jgi:biopolymer transport protein TolQ
MNSELNVLALILNASLPVKLVLGILIGFSIASWFIIFRKKALLDRAYATSDEFE